jgi:hypothetical protein
VLSAAEARNGNINWSTESRIAFLFVDKCNAIPWMRYSASKKASGSVNAAHSLRIGENALILLQGSAHLTKRLPLQGKPTMPFDAPFQIWLDSEMDTNRQSHFGVEVVAGERAEKARLRGSQQPARDPVAVPRDPLDPIPIAIALRASLDARKPRQQFLGRLES